MRRLILILLMIVFLGLVASNWAELEMAAKTLTQGRREWLLAAATSQAVYFVVLTALYQACFYAVGMSSPGGIRELFPPVLSSIFANTATPVAVAGATALFMDYAARHKQSPARAAAGNLLETIADMFALLLVLLAALAYLRHLGDLQPFEVGGVIVLALLICLLVGVLFMGHWQPQRLRRLLVRVERMAGRLSRRLGRPDLLPAGWGERIAGEYTEAASDIWTYPQRLWRVLGWACLAHAIDLITVYCLFESFRQPVDPRVMLSGYAIGILFHYVSITPQGIGTVEGVIALIYSTLGVPAHAAALVAVSFRVLSFWLPLALGFVALRRSKSFRGTHI
jgi:uncharacterized protein (TIRG00374 family)